MSASSMRTYAVSMTYGFVAYIDESGADGLKRVRPKDPAGSSEWFVLSAVASCSIRHSTSTV